MKTIKVGNLSIPMSLFSFSVDGKATLISFKTAKGLGIDNRTYNTVEKLVVNRLASALKSKEGASISFVPHREKEADYGQWSGTSKARFSWDETSVLSLAQKDWREARDIKILGSKLSILLPAKGEAKTESALHGLDYKSVEVACKNAHAPLPDTKEIPFRKSFPSLVSTYEGWQEMTLNQWLQVVANEYDALQIATELPTVANSEPKERKPRKGKQEVAA